MHNNKLKNDREFENDIDIKDIKNSSDLDDNNNIITDVEENENNDAKEIQYLKTKINDLENELQKTQELANNNLNKLKYLMADYDNYKKQTDKQMISNLESFKSNLLLKFINIREDYIRALEIANQKKIDNTVIEGLDGILKNMEMLLKSEGIKEIECVGKQFDPNKHDIVNFVYDDTEDENIVKHEIRKGYILNDKVLRPSMVIVSKKQIIKNNVNNIQNNKKEDEN